MAQRETEVDRDRRRMGLAGVRSGGDRRRVQADVWYDYQRQHWAVYHEGRGATVAPCGHPATYDHGCPACGRAGEPAERRSGADRRGAAEAHRRPAMPTDSPDLCGGCGLHFSIARTVTCPRCDWSPLRGAEEWAACPVCLGNQLAPVPTVNPVAWVPCPNPACVGGLVRRGGAR